MTDKEAIEALISKDVVNQDLILEALDVAVDALRERADRKKDKKGKWIGGHCMCSICKWYLTNRYGFAVRADYNYCPNCGTKMEVKE